MHSRIFQFFLLVIAVAFGYVLGTSAVVDWVTDISNWTAVAWNSERAARSSSGTVPLLIAGFLLGQGLLLGCRQAYKAIAPLLVSHIDQMAAWDATMGLSSRFGLDQFLKHSTVWSAEDPTTRTQTLALFKIRGIDSLNASKGTLFTTVLLKRVCAELRSASVPEGASKLQRWLAVHFPSPVEFATRKAPPLRLAARWAGATFALAFRELDATQAIQIVRDVNAWLRHELSSIDGGEHLSLSTVVAVGAAGTTGLGVASAATGVISTAVQDGILVVVDPADVRSVSISQISGITLVKFVMARHPLEGSLSSTKLRQEKGVFFTFKRWLPAFACFVGAIAVLLISGRTSPLVGAYPWPETMKDVLVVDQRGQRSVRLVRTHLGTVRQGNWEVMKATLVQGELADGLYPSCQIYVSIRNHSSRLHYVSAYDFTAFDRAGRVFSFGPLQMLRLAGGVTGKWLSPGESMSGWIRFSRFDEPIEGIRFEPDRNTHIVATINTSRSDAEPSAAPSVLN